MPPAGGETGAANAELVGQLRDWAKRDGTGIPFDSSAGFTLASGATRSPDAAWVRRSRLANLTAEQKRNFLPLSPDFGVELRSPSDRLASPQEKMEEYIASGTQLGWLLDTEHQRAHIYKPDSPTQVIDQPPTLCADPPLSGFTLDLAPIWKPDL